MEHLIRRQKPKGITQKLREWSHSQSAANLLTAIAILAAIYSYKTANRQDRMSRDAEMRVAVITNKQMGDMMRRIGHRDQELEEVLCKVLEARDPYDPGLLTPKEQKVRQQLDSYLNYLEAVASLWRRGWLKEGDFRGLWAYYLKELTRWDPLWAYVTTEAYEWEDISWAANKLTAKQ